LPCFYDDGNERPGALGTRARQARDDMKKTFSCHLVLLGLILLQSVEAQAPKAERPQATTAEQKQPVEDPLGRSTPRGAAVGLVSAAERDNLDRAAEYLESALKPPDRRELARKLWVVLDRKLFTSLDSLSNKPDGDVDDGLTNRDRLGVVESPSGNVELFLDRVQRGQGNSIWLFSSSTLQEIPRLYDEVQPPWIERQVPERLRTTRWLSLALYQWIAILLGIPLIFGVAALSTRALTGLLSPLRRHLLPEQDAHKLASVGPLRLLVLAAFFYGASFLGLSLAVRHFWNRVAETLMVLALCWLSLRLADVVAALSLRRLQRVHRSGGTALVRLINRLLKAATVTVAVLVLLYLSDVDLTAALTGLGVGGLAIGFGAQKTIENLFGGIMVISDKPINVGDVCKAGEFMGTVEDIGIRSTRIRTVDRTVVAVPNGLLASMSLENFAMRDRIRFQHTVGLGRQTTPDQLRCVLAQIRRLIDAHPRVESASARTRFIRVSSFSLDVEIFAYVLETDQTAFLAIQEELLLGIMDIIDASGTPVA
jgi:MscS family membrane protein